MTSVRDTALDYISAFFNDDGRAKQFIASAYKNGVYDKPLNEVCDNFYQSGLWQLMRCENYNDWEVLQRAGAKPDDIHPDFVDFIQQTACFHRMLDNIESYHDEVVSDIKTALNTKFNELKSKEDTNFNTVDISLGIVKNIHDFSQVFDLIYNSTLNLPEIYYNFANLVKMFTIIRELYIGFIDKSFRGFLGKDGQTHIINAHNYYKDYETRARYAEYIDDILLTNISIRDPNEKIMSVKEFLKMDNYSDLLLSEDGGINVLISIKEKILDDFANAIVKMKQDIRENISFIQENNDDIILMINMIEDTINYLTGKITLDSEFTIEQKVKRSTVSLWDRVFSKWNRLPTEAKEFYKKHIRLMGQTATDGWVILETPDNNNMENKNLRFNLMKENKNDSSSPILFAKTLPRLNSDKDSRMIFKHVRNGEFISNILEKIYLEVYNAKGINIPNENIKNCGTPKASGFDLHPMRYSQSVVNGVKECMKNKTVASKSIESILDLVTGQVIQRDASGNYLKDGKLIDYNALLNSTCGGTGLLSNDDPDCLNLINCLLDDSRGLDTCLNVLRNRDTFSAGRDAALKAHPDVLAKLLRKLGVPIVKRDSMYGTIDAPVSFESWIRNVQNDALRSALNDNENLRNYLKGVISFVSQNPAILNGNINKNTLPLHLQGTKIGWTHDLVKDSPEAFKLGSTILEFARKSGLVGKSFMLSGGMVPADQMKSSFVNLNLMVNNARNLMEKNGKYLVQEDNNAIDALLKKYANNEKTLAKLYGFLDAYNESQHIKRIGGTKKLGEIINEVNEVKALYGGGESNEFTNSINKIFAQQNKIYNKLIFELYPAMINSAFEGDNSVIRKV